MRRKKVGIALSGGGVRGVAHLGVLQALTEQGILISHISGTSAGAIAGAFFAEGYSPQDTLKLITETKLLRYLRPALGNLGLLSMEQTGQLFRQYIPHNTFEELKIPLTICAVDISEGKLSYFNNGELSKAILASSSLPGIFKPTQIDGRLYIDGGVLNNFPVEPLISTCDVIIGSSCNHLPPVKKIDSMKQLIERTAILAVSANIMAKKQYCDAFIEPKGMAGFSVFDTKKAEDIFWLAYDATMRELDVNETLRQLTGVKKQKQDKKLADEVPE
ncbi:MAG: patatin-like phospholipase family protein [Mucilaginibacter polytrichastri]|nr:patatin-like phospholipase family protein [Mucilaginibacter polytrichastri]